MFKEILDNLGGKLRIIVSAAAPIDPKVGKWVQDIGITFLQGYGLTETAPISALTPDYDTRVGSAGKAVVCAELKIKDPNEKGEGEVLIKSKTLMLGYYEDEEATKAVIDEDGWFNSGDVGYLDKDGFLYITGRSKNVIVTQNGKNIYPEEIEMLLKKNLEIKECMVYGKAQENSKELTITARVIPNLIEIEQKTDLILSDKQKEAIEAVNDNNVCIITGGPGTGKTTIIKVILELYKSKKRKTVLCAPTGRAAKRMTETTGEEAKTLHRL